MSSLGNSSATSTSTFLPPVHDFHEPNTRHYSARQMRENPLGETTQRGILASVMVTVDLLSFAAGMGFMAGIVVFFFLAWNFYRDHREAQTIGMVVDQIRVAVLQTAFQSGGFLLSPDEEDEVGH